VRAFATQIGDILVDEGIKMLVVACNTATAAAVHHLRLRYDIPIVGVIEPAVHEHALDRAREERLPLAVEDETAEVAVHERAGVGGEPRERRLAEVDIGDRRAPDVDDAGRGVEVERYVRVPAGSERPGVSWPS